MALYELTLRGFNGETDQTDHLILWVDLDMTELQAQAYLSRAGLYGVDGLVIGVIAVPDLTEKDKADFALPGQLDELKAKAHRLVLEHERPMDAAIERLLVAADNHGEDSGEPDHTVGDLQGLLRRAWDIMSVSQRLQLLQSDEVENLVEAGARDEFEASDLVEAINQKLAKMESDVLAAGYTFMKHEGAFYWQTSEDASEDFPAREEMVASAHSNFVAQTAAS